MKIILEFHHHTLTDERSFSFFSAFKTNKSHHGFRFYSRKKYKRFILLVKKIQIKVLNGGGFLLRRSLRLLMHLIHFTTVFFRKWTVFRFTYIVYLSLVFSMVDLFLLFCTRPCLREIDTNFFSAFWQYVDKPKKTIRIYIIATLSKHIYKLQKMS